MKTIEEIQSELRSLAHELEQLKESRSAGEREIDFERLSIDGSHKPITPHPLGKYDNYAQKCYLTMLLTVARFEEDKLPASLLFAHRIAYGMGYLQKDGNLQSEYIAAQTLSYKQLDDLVEVFKGTDERLMLILECMLTAGMFDKGKKDAIDYIVQLSQLFELSKDDMVFISNMAAVILTQDLNAYKCDIRNKYEVFNCYLNDIVKVKVVFEKGKIYKDKSNMFNRKLISALFNRRYHCSKISCNGNSLKCEYYRSESGLLVVSFGTEIYIDLDGELLSFNKNSPCIGFQTVKDHFLLLVKAKDVEPNCPIGVEAHPLTPFSLIEKKYNDAWERFRESDPEAE